MRWAALPQLTVVQGIHSLGADIGRRVVKARLPMESFRHSSVFASAKLDGEPRWHHAATFLPLQCSLYAGLWRGYICTLVGEVFNMVIIYCTCRNSSKAALVIATMRVYFLVAVPSSLVSP